MDYLQPICPVLLFFVGSRDKERKGHYKLDGTKAT